MPGYDSERFIDLSECDKSELTCSICLKILCSPVVAQCCGQSFCKECITEWLKTNNTCPYDRKVLNENELTQPPRIMVNMLGKLRIHCDYRDKGCEEILVLENLSQHSIKCRYNGEKCEKCSLDLQTSGHDCIKALLELIQQMKPEIEALKSAPSAPVEETNVNLALNEIDELKAERDGLLKQIEELSVRNGTPILHSGAAPISEQEIFNSARKQLWTPSITKNEMSEEVTNKLLAIIRDELPEYNSMFVVCKNIVEKLNREFGNSWHCMANYQNKSQSYFTYESGFLIKLDFGLLSFEIYKTQFLNFKQLRDRFKSGKIKREIKILQTDMKQTMISDVQNIVFSALEKSDTLTDISDELKTQMERRHDGKWQCFVFAYFGVLNIQYKCGTCIYFDLAELTIALFQHLS